MPILRAGTCCAAYHARTAAATRRRTRSRARHFHGPVTYAAALWEQVDWSGFDVVAVNLYRIGADTAGYAERVRRSTATNKPS